MDIKTNCESCQHRYVCRFREIADNFRRDITATGVLLTERLAETPFNLELTCKNYWNPPSFLQRDYLTLTTNTPYPLNGTAKKNDFYYSTTTASNTTTVRDPNYCPNLD